MGYGLFDYMEDHKDQTPKEGEPGDCAECFSLFAEWDEIERKQIDYCCYNSLKTGHMDEIRKGYACPRLNVLPKQQKNINFGCTRR